MKEPARPSPGTLGYLDRAFVDWTSRLVHRGLLEDGHWLLECPGYLCGCCPTVSKLDADHEVLNQLTDMTPAHAFAYALTRRIAEVVVRLSSCWTLAGLLLLLTFSAWRTWQASGTQIVYGRDTQISSSTWWNPKSVSLLLSILTLSILAPTLAEKAFGKVIDYELEILSGRSAHPTSFSVLRPWKVKEVQRRPERPPSLLHLLDFVRLHRSLYGRPAVGNASASCRQTALSLSCWSVLVFVGAAYAVVTLAFRALVWRPAKSLFSCLTKDKSACRTEIADPGTEKSFCALQFADPEVCVSQKVDPKISDRLPVRPRYVSRGVYACLDDEYTLTD